MFAINTASDFLAKAEDDLKLLMSAFDNSSNAINCILSTYHLHEWCWAKDLKARSPLTIRGVQIKTKKDFIGWLDSNCPNFSLIQSLANGTKHLSPVNSTRRIAGYGMGPFGVGPYGASYLLIDLGEDQPIGSRYKVAHSILEESLAFWRKLFSEISIT